jgi:hypothetical protein
VALVLRAVLAFGDVPFKVIGTFGVLVAIVAALCAAMALFRGASPTGPVLQIASLWFVGGAILAAIAILGLYTSIALNEVRRRPTLVRRRYGRD